MRIYRDYIFRNIIPVFKNRKLNAYKCNTRRSRSKFKPASGISGRVTKILGLSGLSILAELDISTFVKLILFEKANLSLCLKKRTAFMNSIIY